MFLSSILLGNGLYSTNQIFAEENQTGTENEAEVKADIEQENKCKKDTECENENKINNSLTITNNGTQTQPSQETPQTCEECFTTILSEQQIQSVLNNEVFPEEIPLNSVQDMCILIADVFDVPEFADDFNVALTQADLTEEQFNELEQCLAELGFPMDLHPLS